MKRLFATLICLVMVFSLLPREFSFAVKAESAETSALSDAEILKQRRDTVYNTMMSMANVLWRATEDFTYNFATSKVTIVKGRLYRGMPYTHARGTLESFLEYAGEPNEKGEREMIGITPEMFEGGSQHARLGNDCSGAATVAYASVSATIKNVGASTVTINKGFIPVGTYTPDPASNSNGKQICIDNGYQVMFQSYAAAQYADLVSCSGHTMMTQKVSVVYADDGTIDGDLSTMTVVHQNPDPIRNNRYFTSGPYSEANYGEKVYRTFLIDDDWTFNELFNAGYMPYTCIELIDPSPIAELVVTDTETEHNFKNIMSGTIKANRLIDCVTMTITDEDGDVVQQGTARCYRTNAAGTNWDMAYDLSQLRLESPMKMKGSLNLNLLGVGNYHCRLDVRFMTGQVVEKVRDFDFTVNEDDLGEGWVDNSDLKFTEVDGKKMAVCPVCGGDPVEWTALPQITSVTSFTASHYYLDKDLNNKSRYSIGKNATVCVHLNGHNITSTSQVFWNGGANSMLNVMGNGLVKGGYFSEENRYGATMHFSSATAQATLYGGTYGHSIESTRATVVLHASQPKLTIYSGATFCCMDDAQGANIEICSGSVDLRGGRVLDGINTTGYGGNVRVYSSESYTGWPSTFTMYDGIIAGGRAKYGGNIAIFRESSSHGSKDRTFTMEDGLIHFGFAGYAAGSEGYGGNIWASGSVAKLNLNGGTVTYGKSYSGGGNIYARNGAQLKIGGIVENGNGDYGSEGTSGGNIYLLGSSTAMSSLTITGTVRNPMTAVSNGGNIFCSRSDIVVDGGTVSGGTATGRGGNIYITNTQASLTVKNNGKIFDGTAALGGNVGLNIEAATINLESGSITGGVASTYGPDLLLYAAATVNISGGTVGHVYGSSGKVNLSGNGSIEKLAMTTGTVKVDNGWSGTADVNWGGKYVSDGVLTKASCGITSEGIFTAGGTYAGILTYDGEARAFGKNGVISLGTSVSNSESTTWYPTVAEAMEAAPAGSTVKLFTDAELVLDKDTYVDVNGRNVTVSGTGTLYGIDSSNNDYDGYATVAVSGNVAKDVTDPATGNRYISIVKDGQASFHRLNMRPSFVTLRPDAAGLYYKAQFDCDTALAAEVSKHGTVLSVDNMPGEDFLSEMWDINRYTVAQETFAPGAVVTSGSVFNILKTSNSAAVNARNGETKIYANAYLLLKDGTFLVADQTCDDTAGNPEFDGAAFSLYDVLKTIDDNWQNYEDSHDRILQFYATWAPYGMNAWSFENIK